MKKLELIGFKIFSSILLAATLSCNMHLDVDDVDMSPTFNTATGSNIVKRISNDCQI